MEDMFTLFLTDFGKSLIDQQALLVEALSCCGSDWVQLDVIDGDGQMVYPITFEVFFFFKVPVQTQFLPLLCN